MIYCISDPITSEFRYVGKSINLRGRILYHLREHGDTHKVRWLRSLSRLNLSPIVMILEVNPLDWKRAERFWIKSFKTAGYRLLNETDGGDGVHNPSQSARQKIGKFRSDKWKNERDVCMAIARNPVRCKRISNSLKGRKNPWNVLSNPHNQPGWHHTPRSCQKISKSLIGNSRRTGKPSSEEVKLAASLRLKGNQHTKNRVMPDYEKKARSLANLGQKRSLETVNRQSKAALLRWKEVSLEDRRAHVRPAVLARVNRT